MRSGANLLGNIIRAVNCQLARRGIARPGLPITLTFSVTNRCQSRCKTCLIWKFHENRPELVQKELSLDEIERVFKGMGTIAFFNISGGEPFLRDDLPNIVALALAHLRPSIVHIPTNALMPGRIERQVSEMLEHISQKSPGVKLSVKPSLDGLREHHDEIRGVPGNFDKVIETIKRLRPLSDRFPQFVLEVGTVISRLNMDSIEAIASFVHSLGIESYRSELAETRTELANKDADITPSPDDYERAINVFKRHTIEGLKGKRRYTRMLEAMRLVYYGLALRTLREQRQVIPCYAGISNAHLDPYGELWACCTMAGDASLGNVRETGYDFWRIWHSRQADEVRASIRRGECFCPLANQAYSNIILSPTWLLKTATTFVRYAALR
ncbi:MAG TPA: radical SAM protein [bacterium]|nr:radical SAM protein [bacterium]